MTEAALDNPAQARVQAILDELTGSGQETGIQVAAYHDGALAVDAWSGLADTGDDTRDDSGDGRAVDAQTLIHAWSAAKGIAGALVAVLVDQGLLDYDAPVGSYWPEYANRGKEHTTLGHVLTHSAGVPQLRPDLTPEELFDVPATAAWLAEQEPLWEPGTASGYHGWTYGVLLAEILRRATGRTCDQLLHDELAAPLGIADSVLFRVPDRLLPGLATCYDGGWKNRLRVLPRDSPFRIMAPRAVLPVAELANRADYRRIALPACGTMTARAAARIYALFACGGEIDGVRLVSEATVREAIAPRVVGVDRILGFPMTKGYGFMIGGPGPTARSLDAGFGTDGSGGNTGCADQPRRFSFALVKNRMSAYGLDQRIAGEIRTVLGITA